MGSAIYLLSAILVFGAELPAESTGVLKERIAQSTERLPAPVLPVMTGSETKVRVLTASDQTSANPGAARTQRWIF